MFTLITSGFFCQAPKQSSDGYWAFQRETLQNIASAIDIITGLGLIIAGFALHMPSLTMIGALQLWPLAAFITFSLLAYKRGLENEPIYVRFRPCSQ
jgi:hypothetical protein